MQTARRFRLSGILLLAAACFTHAARADFWPLWTTEPATVAGHPAAWSAAGPLFFGEDQGDSRVTGLRPFFLGRHYTDQQRTTYHLLFPFFVRDENGGDVRWSVFSLANSFTAAPPDGAGGGRPSRGFDLWPFYFSRDTGDPATSYHALLPFGGTIKNRFGSDRIETLFAPLWVRTETAGTIVDNTPWPFIKTIRGGGQSGFQFWPLFGWRQRDSGALQRFALWPCYLERVRPLEDGHRDEFRAWLPFYSRRTAPGLSDWNAFLLFGQTRQEEPAYREDRYLWPLLVQGRGANGRLVNRWAPVYAHSRRNGVDKRWILWPLFRTQDWTEGNLEQSKVQLAYFVYWRLEQRDRTRPDAAPATKTHLWPLLSEWDNGAGRRQVQILSPFEVFYPHDRNVRTLWSPLFALYRYDRRAADEVRTSLLFDFARYRRRGESWRFDLGPLIQASRTEGRGGFSLLRGLVAREPAARDSRARWRFLWIVPASRDRSSAAASQP